jgi:hypothetical protein
MPGYSINWIHKVPTTILHKQSNVSGQTYLRHLNTNELSPIPLSEDKEEQHTFKKFFNPFPHKNNNSTYISTNNKVPLSNSTNLNNDSKDKPHFFTGDEEESDHARKSLKYGLFSLGFPVLGFLILFVIVISTGGVLANPLTYAILLFLAGCVTGLVFAVLAVINGFMAINEINAAPDTYTGKGNAILGIILAAVFALSIIGYFVIRNIKK